MNNIENQLSNINILNSEKNAMLLCYINYYKNQTSYSTLQLIDMSLKLQHKVKIKDETSQVYPCTFEINEIQIIYIIHYLIIMYFVFNII